MGISLYLETGSKKGGCIVFDTLRVTFCEFIIKDLSDWKLCADISATSFNPVKIRQNNAFLGDISYNLEKAYYNTERINMTIKSLNELNYLIVSFSIPKFLYGDNVHEITGEDFEELFLQMNKEIVNAGIFANFETANISRLDFCSNIKTDYTFSAYKGLFQFVQTARMKKVEYDGETFYWRNKSRELKVYDKNKDVYAKDGISLEYNLMRFEKSLLKKETHKDIKKLIDFKNDEKVISGINNYYNDLLKLFEVKDFPDSTLDPWAMIQEFKKLHPKASFKKMVEFYGIITMFKDMPETIINEFCIDEIPRSSSFKIKKQINQVVKSEKMIKNIDNKKLHSEIVEKLECSRYEKIKSF